jgi:tellurite resistance protein TehA-like permease
VATWWIPLLIALMIWRYVVRKEVPRYEPALWGMVFPLGMYTTATFQLSRATGLGFLASIPEVFIFIALAAWLMAFAGLLRRLWSSMSSGATVISAEVRRS